MTNRVSRAAALASREENLRWTAAELSSFPRGESVLAAIRRKCLDCSCWQPTEVRDCPLTRCALWPYRLGRNPLRPPRPANTHATVGETPESGTSREADHDPVSG